MCGEVGRDSRLPVSEDGRTSVGETEKGDDNEGPASSPDVCIRGRGAGLSDVVLEGSSDICGELTAESSMLMVGARCRCVVGDGEGVPSPSGVVEAMVSSNTSHCYSTLPWLFKPLLASVGVQSASSRPLMSSQALETSNRRMRDGGISVARV